MSFFMPVPPAFRVAFHRKPHEDIIGPAKGIFNFRHLSGTDGKKQPIRGWAGFREAITKISMDGQGFAAALRPWD